MTFKSSIQKAGMRFSKIVRRVRGGRVVTVSYRNEPAAEIQSIEPTPTLGERLSDLERSGSLVRSSVPRQTFRPVERRTGALSRFLAERED